MINRILGFGIIQALNYISPIIILPILAKSLSLSSFGVYSVYVTIASFGAIIADMGISTVTAQKMSRAQTKEITAEILGSALTTRVSLTLITYCAGSTIGLIFFNDEFNAINITITAIGTLGIVANPSYYYIAKNEIKEFVIINSIAKAATAILMLILSTHGMTITIALTATFTPPLIASIILNRKLFLKYEISCKNINPIQAFQELIKIKAIGISSLMAWIYISCPIIITAKYLGPESAALYGAAERIMNAIKSLLTPFLNAIHPIIFKDIDKKRKVYRSKILRIIQISFIFCLIISSFTIWYSSEIFEFIDNNKYSKSASILSILSIIPLFFAISNILGNYVLIANSMNKQYFKSILSGLTVFAVLNYFNKQNPENIAISAVAAEMVVCLFMSIYSYRFLSK